MRWHSYLDDTVGTGADTVEDMQGADSAEYGIGVSTDLYVAGVSTVVGVSTFQNELYVGGDLYVADDIVYDEQTSRNLDVTGIATFAQTNTSGLSTFSGYAESVNALGTLSNGSTHDLKVDEASVFTCTINATDSVTLRVINAVAGKMCSGLVIVTFTGSGTRGIGVTTGRWQGGSAPTWSTSAATDVFSFFTPDNCSNVYVNAVGVGFA